MFLLIKKLTVKIVSVIVAAALIASTVCVVFSNSHKSNDKIDSHISNSRQANQTPLSEKSLEKSIENIRPNAATQSDRPTNNFLDPISSTSEPISNQHLDQIPQSDKLYTKTATPISLSSLSAPCNSSSNSSSNFEKSYVLDINDAIVPGSNFEKDLVSNNDDANVAEVHSIDISSTHSNSFSKANSSENSELNDDNTNNYIKHIESSTSLINDLDKEENSNNNKAISFKKDKPNHNSSTTDITSLGDNPVYAYNSLLVKHDELNKQISELHFLKAFYHDCINCLNSSELRSIRSALQSIEWNMKKIKQCEKEILKLEKEMEQPNSSQQHIKEFIELNQNLIARCKTDITFETDGLPKLKQNFLNWYDSNRESRTTFNSQQDKDDFGLKELIETFRTNEKISLNSINNIINKTCDQSILINKKLRATNYELNETNKKLSAMQENILPQDVEQYSIDVEKEFNDLHLS